MSRGAGGTASERITGSGILGAVQGSTRTGKFVATVQCTTCPATGRWSATKLASPEHVFTALRERGWSDPQFKPRCKACTKAQTDADRAAKRARLDANRQEREAFKGDTAMPSQTEAERKRADNARLSTMIDAVAVANTPNADTIYALPPYSIVAPGADVPPNAITAVPAAAERSPSAKKGHREAIAALELYYDEATGTYREGATDASIAEDIGLAPAYIAKTREEYFGPLKVPGEVAAIEARIEKLIAEATTVFTTIRKNLDADVAALRRDLGALVSKNGWAK